MALYCAIRHFDNFEEAMIAAVNHGGDSDRLEL
ncbi:ADP-ribosylglycohydrolase family protein [Prevotella sp.]